MSRRFLAAAFALALSAASFAQDAPPTEPAVGSPLKPEVSHAVEPLPATPGEREGAPQPDLDVAAKIVRERTNAFRKEHGHDPVTPDDRLTKTAQAFADYMASHHVYGHEADGRTPADRVTEHGYEYCSVRENIAFEFDEAGFTTDRLGESFFTGWKNSPEHRANMLAEEVVDTGVGIAKTPKSGKYFAVQLFGRPRSREYSFTVANETEATIPYRVGDRDYELTPRLARTHTECLAAKVAFLPIGAGPKPAASDAAVTPATTVEKRPSEAPGDAEKKPGPNPIATIAVSAGDRLVATPSDDGYTVEKSKSNGESVTPDRS